jgi:hypothetical protein
MPGAVAEQRLRIGYSQMTRETSHKSVVPLKLESQDSADGIADSDGLDGRGAGVRVPVEARFFSSPRRRVFQIEYGSHPASYPMGTGGDFLGG